MKTHEQRHKEEKEKLLLKINREDGSIIRFASKELRDDKEVVLAAVSDNGTALRYALRYASDRLKNDKEVVLASVKQNGQSIRYANRALRDDKEIALAAINDYSKSAQYVNRRWFDDEDFIMSICDSVYRSIVFNRLGSNRLKSNKRFMLKLLDSLYTIYDKTILPELTNDIDIIRVALNSDIYSFRFFVDYLYENQEVFIPYIYDAVMFNGRSRNHRIVWSSELIDSLKSSHRRFIIVENFVKFLNDLNQKNYDFNTNNYIETHLKHVVILKNKIIEDLPIIKSWSEDMLLTHYENIYYGRNEDIKPVALPDFE